MNKKQICKCTTTGFGTPETLYGISDGNGFYLLENGKIGREKDTELCNANNLFTSHFHKSAMPIVVPSATRNVPPEIRQVLETKYKDFIHFFQIKEQAIHLLQQMDLIETSIMSTKRDIEKATGVLSPEEFVQVFRENLSDEMKYDLDHQTCRSYLSDEDGKWEIWQPYNDSILIQRHVWIDKYIGNSSYDFLYREYDGCLQINTNHSKDYQKIIDRYRKKLNCSDEFKLSESLLIGDKESLYFNEWYTIPIGKQPLTKELAIELAEDFDLNLEKEDEYELD